MPPYMGVATKILFLDNSSFEILISIFSPKTKKGRANYGVSLKA
jgi:hypothetical protein